MSRAAFVLCLLVVGLIQSHGQEDIMIGAAPVIDETTSGVVPGDLFDIHTTTQGSQVYSASVVATINGATDPACAVTVTGTNNPVVQFPLTALPVAACGYVKDDTTVANYIIWKGTLNLPVDIAIDSADDQAAGTTGNGVRTIVVDLPFLMKFQNKLFDSNTITTEYDIPHLGRAVTSVVVNGNHPTVPAANPKLTFVVVTNLNYPYQLNGVTVGGLSSGTIGTSTATPTISQIAGQCTGAVNTACKETFTFDIDAASCAQVDDITFNLVFSYKCHPTAGVCDIADNVVLADSDPVTMRGPTGLASEMCAWLEVEDVVLAAELFLDATTPISSGSGPTYDSTDVASPVVAAVTNQMIWLSLMATPTPFVTMTDLSVSALYAYGSESAGCPETAAATDLAACNIVADSSWSPVSAQATDDALGYYVKGILQLTPGALDLFTDPIQRQTQSVTIVAHGLLTYQSVSDAIALRHVRRFRANVATSEKSQAVRAQGQLLVINDGSASSSANGTVALVASLGGVAAIAAIIAVVLLRRRKNKNNQQSSAPAPSAV